MSVARVIIWEHNYELPRIIARVDIGCGTVIISAVEIGGHCHQLQYSEHRCGSYAIAVGVPTRVIKYLKQPKDADRTEAPDNEEQ